MKMKHDFVYVSKHSAECKEVHGRVMALIRDVHQELRLKYQLTFQDRMVGSYARNMITYDKKSNIGFDFDVNIDINDEEERFSAKELRKILKEAIDQHVKKYGFDHAEDSTRVLTIKEKDTKESKILHSVDFAIINDYKDDSGYLCQEYVHFHKKQKTYYWEKQSKGYEMLQEKFDWIDRQELRQELRERYIEKKNQNQDINIHSRTILAISVHEICQKFGYYDELSQSNQNMAVHNGIFMPFSNQMNNLSVSHGSGIVKGIICPIFDIDHNY